MSGTTESGDPSPSSLDYYAYALDGVGPLVGNDAPTSVRAAGSDTGASKGLTLAQVQSIFECVYHQLGPDHRQRSHGRQRTYRVVLATGGVWDAGRLDRCPRVRPHQVWGVALSLHLDHPADHRIRARAGNTSNEENTQDGIIYQNSIGDPNAAGGAIPADSISPPPVDSVAAAAIYLYSAGKFSQQWNDTTDYNSTHNNYCPAGDRRQQHPRQHAWGTSWPAPCPLPPCGARRARARRTWT